MNELIKLKLILFLKNNCFFNYKINEFIKLKLILFFKK